MKVLLILSALVVGSQALCSYNLTTMPHINGLLVQGEWFLDSVVDGDGGTPVAPPDVPGDVECFGLKLKDTKTNGKPTVTLTRQVKSKTGGLNETSVVFNIDAINHSLVFKQGTFEAQIFAPASDYSNYLALYSCITQKPGSQKGTALLLGRSSAGVGSVIRAKVQKQLEKAGWSVAHGVTLTPWSNCKNI